MELERLVWLATVLSCLVTTLILVLNGYIGYPVVTFAVAAAASINLL